jgi:hypothetical protein
MFCAAFVGDNLDIDAVDGNVAIIWNDKRNVTTPLTPKSAAISSAFGR